MSNSRFESKQAYQKVLNDHFQTSDDDFEAVFDSMWSPDLEAVIDGKPSDYNTVKTLLKGLRSSMASSEITVLFLLREGNIFAERHSAKGVSKDGKSTHVEAYCFGELDDQERIRKFEEAVIIRGDYEHPVRNDQK